MGKKIEAAGYMIQDIQGNAIYGVGTTADQAWNDAWSMVKGDGPFTNGNDEILSQEEVRETHFKTVPATQTLIDRVESVGGAIAWRQVGGVACTEEEEQAFDEAD